MVTISMGVNHGGDASPPKFLPGGMEYLSSPPKKPVTVKKITAES